MQTLFLNAAVTDATRAEPRLGNVLVEDGVIRDVQARAGTAENRETIDLRGRTLMPGLVDSHVHVVASTMDLTMNAQLPDALAVLRSLPIMKGMLDRGFTRVRDVGGAPPAPSDAIAEGLVPAPRVVACGKALSKTGGHADNRPRHDTHDATRWGRNYGALGRVADGVDEVRRACRQELRQGARFIKVMANGGVSSPTDPIAWQGYSVSELTAIVEEARDAQTYVSAHLYQPDAMIRALQCGVHSLEDCNNIDAPAARLAAERGAVAVPTLVTYEALAEDGEALGLAPVSIAKIEAVRTNGLGSLSILREAGVTMAFGTDLLGEAHVRQNQEFAIRSRVLPSAEVFASATAVGAELCVMAGQIGVVAPGALADLLVVDGAPLDDIAVLADPLRNVLVMMKGGHVHRRRGL